MTDYPTDQDITDAAERHAEGLEADDARLARDAAFCAWLRMQRGLGFEWSEIIADAGMAMAGIPIERIQPFAALASAESWSYVLRKVAEVMEQEAFTASAGDPRR